MDVPDNGPVIVGITWWLTILCGIFLGLRLYAKLSRRQRLWWDDHILIASWILLLVEAILTQYGQMLGFGKRTIDIKPEHLALIALGTSIGASISCFASTFSKISFGITLLRLTEGKTKLFVWFSIITLFLTMIPSALFTWIQCTPVEKAWNTYIEGTCWPGYITVNYGIFNAAWCAVIDFALALLPWTLIWGLQLKLKERIGVSIAMSLGVLSGICAIVKGVYVVQLRQQDFYYNGKDVTIWTAVETATAIIAASIPVLRVFFKEKVSSFSNSRGKSTTNTGNRNSRSGVPLSVMNRSQRSSHTQTTMGKNKEGGWTSLEPIEDGSQDGLSQRSVLGDEESGRGCGDAGMAVVGGDVFATKGYEVSVEGNNGVRVTTATTVTTGPWRGV